MMVETAVVQSATVQILNFFTDKDAYLDLLFNNATVFLMELRWSIIGFK